MKVKEEERTQHDHRAGGDTGTYTRNTVVEGFGRVAAGSLFACVYFVPAKTKNPFISKRPAVSGELASFCFL